jgi:hypothetical protein
MLVVIFSIKENLSFKKHGITLGFHLFSFIGGVLWVAAYHPLANEVAKGYSNATVRPSFCNIIVNTLESTSFNGF